MGDYEADAVMPERWQPTHRHYKGGLYRVIGEAVHTETSAFLTIYDNEHGNIFARPQGMFYGTIEDGSPRFRALAPPDARASGASPQESKDFPP